MQKDALSYVQKCGKCQRFAPIIRQPATDLHPITSPWPFAQWGLDIVGPFPKALNKKYLIVGIDYFTKWVEAEASQKIRDQDVISFLWKNIFTRFGIPRALIADNGTQFKSSKTQEFCEGYGIKMYFSTPSYPQSNGQAEASNKVIVDGLKKRLEESKGKWLEELPSVLWTFRTTPRRSTGDSPFALAFGTEAVIPLEVGLPTLRTNLVDAGGNKEALEENLDFIEERREAAQIKLASYHQTLMQQRQKHLHQREFRVGDLVLRKVTLNTTNPTDGKLGPNWEGPYVVTSAGGTGAYHLEDMEGRAIPNPWNVSNLRKFFQ